MSRITVLGMDPAFSNFGLALVEVDLRSKELFPKELCLIRTEALKSKQVRVSSDKLRRAREIALIAREWEKRAHLIAAEIPSGAQSAAASNALGISLGILAGHTAPLIEVSAREAKKGATGHAQATKAEMIEWATGNWPELNWIVSRGRITDANEHLADALAIVRAATLTPAFDQATAMMLSMIGDAA